MIVLPHTHNTAADADAGYRSWDPTQQQQQWEELSENEETTAAAAMIALMSGGARCVQADQTTTTTTGYPCPPSPKTTTRSMSGDTARTSPRDSSLTATTAAGGRRADHSYAAATTLRDCTTGSGSSRQRRPTATTRQMTKTWAPTPTTAAPPPQPMQGAILRRALEENSDGAGDRPHPTVPFFPQQERPPPSSAELCIPCWHKQRERQERKRKEAQEAMAKEAMLEARRNWHERRMEERMHAFYRLSPQQQRDLRQESEIARMRGIVANTAACAGAALGAAGCAKALDAELKRRELVKACAHEASFGASQTRNTDHSPSTTQRIDMETTIFKSRQLGEVRLRYLTPDAASETGIARRQNFHFLHT